MGHITNILFETAKEGGYHNEVDLKKIKKQFRFAKTELDNLGRLCINQDGKMDKLEQLLELTNQRDDATVNMKNLLEAYEQLALRFSSVMNGNILESDRYIIQKQRFVVAASKNILESTTNF